MKNYKPNYQEFCINDFYKRDLESRNLLLEINCPVYFDSCISILEFLQDESKVLEILRKLKLKAFI